MICPLPEYSYYEQSSKSRSSLMPSRLLTKRLWFAARLELREGTLLQRYAALQIFKGL